MPVNPWKVPQDISQLTDAVRERHHQPRLATASIACCFDDSKPYIRNKINFGKVVKFNELNKLYHAQKHDFCIVLCSDLWYSLLIDSQREALLDLQLTRCGVEYVPVTAEVNGRKKVVKDQWGRIEYTDEFKLNENGDMMWKVLPLELSVLTKNVRRYGLWFNDLLDLKDAIANAVVDVAKTDVPELV